MDAIRKLTDELGHDRTFRVTIGNLDYAAMEGGDLDVLAELLTRVARRLQTGEGDGVIRDDNGNPVGTFEFRETEETADQRYQLALGYARGVLAATPAGVSLGIDNEAGAAKFADAYREAFEADPGRTLEVATAFGEWRYTGGSSVVPEED